MHLFLTNNAYWKESMFIFFQWNKSNFLLKMVSVCRSIIIIITVGYSLLVYWLQPDTHANVFLHVVGG